jgi:hypothetical protein
MSRSRARLLAPWIVSMVLAAGLGWFVVSRYGPAKPAGRAPDAIDLYSCPMEGAKSIGRLEAGDPVWMIGVSGDRWGVIHHPDDVTRPAWVPLAQLSPLPDLAGLPEMSCTDDPVTGTTAPATTAPPTTLPGATTTSTTTTTSSTTTTSTTTTIASDRTPPTVTLSSNRPYLYTTPAAACPDETSLEVSVAVADPTLPLTIRSITANWSVPAGPQSAPLTPATGNRFTLVVPENGPATGEVTLIITATAADGAGNVGAGTITVSLRAPGSFGCA